MHDFDVVCVGAVNLDVIAVVGQWPGSDARVTTDQIIEAGGGPAATAAVTMARQGIRVAFCGLVADDEDGRRVRAQLEAEGVDTRYLRTAPEAITPRSVVLVETAAAARTIVTTVSVPPAAADIPLTAAPWFHADQTGAAVLIQAKRDSGADIRISIDAGNPTGELDLNQVALYAPTVASLAAHYPADSTEGSLRAAHQAGAQLVVATDGADGALCSDGTTITRVPAFAGEIVSTLGAGDVFHGALLAALVRKKALPDAVEWASAVAKLSCAGLDGRSAIPTAEETASYLADKPRRNH